MTTLRATQGSIHPPQENDRNSPFLLVVVCGLVLFFGCETEKISSPWDLSPRLAPTLKTPANLAIGTPLYLTLTWESAAGAGSYHLQVATDAAFTGIVLDRLALDGTACTLDRLRPNSVYWWRVAGANQHGQGPYSSPSTFTTAKYLDYPANVGSSRTYEYAINQRTTSYQGSGMYKVEYWNWLGVHIWDVIGRSVQESDTLVSLTSRQQDSLRMRTALFNSFTNTEQTIHDTLVVQPGAVIPFTIRLTPDSITVNFGSTLPPRSSRSPLSGVETFPRTLPAGSDTLKVTGSFGWPELTSVSGEGLIKFLDVRIGNSYSIGERLEFVR